MTKPIVLITGATGYVGSHVAAQLLEQGYTVRAAVRLGKSERIRSMFPDAGDKLETTEIESLNSDFTLALQGVGAVIHCAAPLTPQFTGKEIVDGAYHGTVNIVETAIKSGVKKIVITGTAASQADIEWKSAFGTEVMTEKSYCQDTLESIGDLETKPNIVIYQVAKTDADKKVWEIAHQHPDVDFTILLPPAILGPFLPSHPPPADVSGLGGVAYMYNLLTGSYPAIPVGHMVDVRDVAKAHVLALTTAPLKDGRDKRLSLCSKIFTWSEAAQVIREKRPELADRLPGPSSGAGPPQTNVPVDTQFAADVLGLKDYIPWEETILSNVDYVLKWEKATGVKA